MALRLPPTDSGTDLRPAFACLDDDPRPLDWNGPADRPFAPFRDEDLERPIIEQFERIVRRQPSQIAIRDASSALTFGELRDGVSGLAEMVAAGTGPGDLIAIMFPAGAMCPAAMLACLAAGRPFLALDPHAPADWVDRMLRDARPTLMITAENGLGGIEDRMPPLRVVRLARLPGPARQGWRPASMGVDEPACVLLTSGSTGRPKGVVNSQRNLLQRVAQSVNAAHISPSDNLLTLAPPSTIVGVRDVLTALLSGARIHLVDPHGAGAREILGVIRAERITILFAFPALLRSVVAARSGHADANLRLVRVGGDTMLWSDVEMLRAWLAPQTPIQLVYAATEAPMMQWFVDDRCRRDDPRVPIGYPLPGNRLALVDEHGRPTPPGDVGELVVASAYVSLGCWAEGRVADDRVETGGERGWRVFRTGDLVRQRSDGLLERVGRKDRRVKVRGVGVDLDGVEAMLRGHPFVQDVAVFARSRAADPTTTLVAYVRVRDEAPSGVVDDLKSFARSAPAACRPARFYPVPTIPRLASSKLDIRAITALDDAQAQRERADSSDGADVAAIGGDPVARTVARVWQDVLRVPVRGGGDDFFDSGGDSLTAITFALELERALGVEIPLTLIDEAPTFARLCQALRERRTPGPTPLVTLKAGHAGVPPVFFIPGIGGSVVNLLPTARRVTYRGEVIGVRARGLVSGEVPHTTIAAMAAEALQAIKERQPDGPYHLCGYSSGGLVAFEMACRLSEAGDEVGLVGLFDTRMSPVRWPVRAWLSIATRRIVPLAAGAWRAWRSRAGIARSIRVAASTAVASANYYPGFYRGRLTVFSPPTGEPRLPPIGSVWKPHARTVEVVEIAGTHATMLSAVHAESAARSLTWCLE